MTDSAAAPASERAARVQAPPGRRTTEVVANSASGSYRIFSALDREGPMPRAGQFYMLTAGRHWSTRDERPFLPRAFAVADAAPTDDGIRLDFLVDGVGPGTERLASLEAGEGLWVTGPLGRSFSMRVPGANPGSRRVRFTDVVLRDASGREIRRLPHLVVLAQSRRTVDIELPVAAVPGSVTLIANDDDGSGALQPVSFALTVAARP